MNFNLDIASIEMRNPDAWNNFFGCIKNKLVATIKSTMNNEVKMLNVFHQMIFRFVSEFLSPRGLVF